MSGVDQERARLRREHPAIYQPKEPPAPPDFHCPCRRCYDKVRVTPEAIEHMHASCGEPCPHPDKGGDPLEMGVA